MTTKHALSWSAFWVLLASVFGGGIYMRLGAEPAATFATCYIIEKLLSMDNLFMFYLIFKYFRIRETSEQAKLLYIGIISAFILRAIVIFTGTSIIQDAHWLTYGFGAFLCWSACKLSTDTANEQPEAPASLITMLYKYLPASLVCIATIEITDILFAFDSIPAALAVTQEPYYIYTANIFAILGLRAMYFILLGLIERFHYMPKAIALILGFIGFKMLVGWYVPQVVTLSLVGIVLAGAAGLSYLKQE